MGGNEENAKWAKEYCSKVEAELQKICDAILNLLDGKLIGTAGNGESKVFYQKMKADYYRYIAEFTDRDAKSKAAESARAAYACTGSGGEGLGGDPPHPLGLGL